jgi:hypothetical protein
MRWTVSAGFLITMDATRIHLDVPNLFKRIEINDLPPDFSPVTSGSLFREKEDGRSFFLL